MNDDLPPDLPRLRILETWHTVQLGRIRIAITAAEQQEAQQQRDAANRAARQPAAPAWFVGRGHDAQRSPVQVHEGGCRMGGKHTKAATREQALRLLADGVEPCPHCRPDTALGLL
ncbi:DUF6233 domain-containing protein [Streptomyces sp. NPDC088258]|uniref:DUF6233 domain-containing protein n=1 Tax=Streptomyces sp. NPDC088258 TaxID=3365849 RepID=UPI0038116771